MIDAKHIAALEVWLTKTREEQNQLMGRLREAEDEVEQLRSQIGALDEIAQQAESMIDSAIVLVRGGAPAQSGTKSRTNILMDVDPKPAKVPERPRNDTQAVPFAQPSTVASGAGGTVAYLDRARNGTLRNNKIEAISNRFADRTITQACTLLLREAGYPLHVNELYKLLVSGGMEFKGNNPTISVAVSLNRNRRFKKVGPGTFDLMIREASQHQAAS